MFNLSARTFITRAYLFCIQAPELNSLFPVLKGTIKTVSKINLTNGPKSQQKPVVFMSNHKALFFQVEVTGIYQKIGIRNIRSLAMILH